MRASMTQGYQAGLTMLDTGWINRVYSADMTTNVYVLHNAKDVLTYSDHDIWLVIDTVSGTAISSHSTREEAEKDLAIVTGFYERWPSGDPTDNAYTPEGVDEDGGITHRWQPLLSPGFWSEHGFGLDP